MAIANGVNSILIEKTIFVVYIWISSNLCPVVTIEIEILLVRGLLRDFKSDTATCITTYQRHTLHSMPTNKLGGGVRIYLDVFEKMTCKPKTLNLSRFPQDPCPRVYPSVLPGSFVNLGK